MKKHILAVAITTVLCFSTLLLAFYVFLNYSKAEYEKNFNQLEQFGESTADQTCVNVSLPEDKQNKTDLLIETPTPTPSLEPTPTETPTPTPTISPKPILTPDETTTEETSPNLQAQNPESSDSLDATSNSPDKPSAFNGHIVAIDAGHQRKGNSEKEPLGPGSSELKAKVSSGTTGSYTGVAEYVVNLDVALLLRDELKHRGYQVVMIRETHDVNISNSERAAIANNSGAEIFIRIHCNGVDNTSVNGALTMAPTADNPYVGNVASECKRLSQIIVDEYCAATGFKNMGIQYYDNMSGINWCKIPVTIIEMGFMTNEEDDRKLVDPNMQKKMAIGMANGIDQYFGL